jgi:hypothetical protein
VTLALRLEATRCKTGAQATIGPAACMPCIPNYVCVADRGISGSRRLAVRARDRHGDAAARLLFVAIAGAPPVCRLGAGA